MCVYSSTETPAFQRAIERRERVRVPLVSVIRNQPYVLVLATLAAVTTFVMSYLMTVFTLSWGTTALGFSRQEFLLLQMIGVLFFGATIAISIDRGGSLRQTADADRFQPRRDRRSA